MRLFQTHLGLSWTRYDVISVSAARLLVAAVANFTAIHEENLWETGPGSWFQQLISCGFVLVSRMCQQQSLLANLAMFLLASKIVSFHHLGIENRSQHFSPWVSNHVPRRCTNFGRLGKAVAAVPIDPELSIVWGVEIGTDWTGIFKHKQ